MNRDIRTYAIATSVGVAVVMLAGKCGAYWLTGSMAILSDAVESVVHIFATGIAAFSLWLSHQEACRKHPYGHGKIAYFSAGFEGALILSAALYIVYTSIVDLIEGPELHRLGIGILITGGLGLVNLFLGIFLVRVGKKHNSLILIANGKHVLTDMWTSAGVVLGVALVWATGIAWLDPVVAIIMGGNILVSAVGLIARSANGLLDAADPKATLKLLDCLEHAVNNGLIRGYHQLRHRQSNDAMWIQVHVLVPETMATLEAHERATTVERDIEALFPDFEVFVTTHAEPDHHTGAHPEGHGPWPDPYAHDSVADSGEKESH